MEVWRDIPGQKGRYQVSNKCGVRSSLQCKKGEAWRTKSVFMFWGKRVVSLHLRGDGRSTRVPVAELVQQAFPDMQNNMKEASAATTAPCPSVTPVASADQTAAKMILALKKLGPLIDLNDIEQTLHAYCRLRELLPAINSRREI